MASRRTILKLGLAAAAGGVFAKSAMARTVPQSGLVFPSGFRPSIEARPSPPATPFIQPLFEMPKAVPISRSVLEANGGAIDPLRHQRFNDFLPQKFYIQRLQEFLWQYHPEGPYGSGSWSWGFNGITPGCTFHTRYGEPLFVRRINELPPVGTGHVPFALPSTTIHVHNGHQASESDGNPADWFDSGEFWDHHYPSFPAGFDPTEYMNTLWYHDHRLDFTAPNVYAGLSGFFLAFDPQDSGDERDETPGAFRFPSGKYDVPLILHDVQFGADGQVVWDFAGSHPEERDDPNTGFGHYGPNMQYNTHGMLGDRFTVNRRIQPYFEVERRKYRFRILNGGPSRLYRLFLTKSGSDAESFHVISEDGNLLPEAIKTESVDIWVANRNDIIVDFSKYNDGDKIYLTNRLEMRPDGAGPRGKLLDQGDRLMEFRVRGRRVQDHSRIPEFIRPLPKIDMSEVRREREFVFDYDNGLWTVNGRLMDPNRIDAKIEQGTAEIWTIRNTGHNWGHPIHTHFEEFQIIEKNGKPISHGDILKSRKDVIRLGPGDEIKFFSRWRDFFGKYVMHCHNVVHEDHAMMIRWDIVPKGQGD